MSLWLVKSAIATVAVIPVFIAIPYFRRNFGVDPLVYLCWYFTAAAISVATYLSLSGRANELIMPGPGVVAAIIAIGLTLGAIANGALFQAVIAAPNPGLPPVIYATSSMVIFVISIFLANSFPQIFVPATSDPLRLAGIILVIGGLFLLAGGAGSSSAN
jgi:hypothetical protein